MEDVLNHNRVSNNFNANEINWITAILDETADYLEIAQYANSGNEKPFELERKYLLNEIQNLTEEIKQTGTYTTFQNNLKSERINQNRISYKKLKIEENKTKIESLIKRLPITKRESESELGILEEKVETIKNKVDLVKEEEKLRVILASDKLRHDVIVSRDLLADKESKMIKKKDDLKSSLRREITANESIEAFLKLKIQELKIERDHCQIKLYDQMKNDKYEIAKLRDEIESLKYVILNMTEECKLYMTTIKQDTIEKLVLKSKMEREATEVKAIIRVQAWWKGVMVRKGLGIYAKKRKKKFKGNKTTKEIQTRKTTSVKKKLK